MSIQPFISKQAAFGACLISAAGALVFNTFPQVLTAIAVQFDLGEAEVGSLISAYMGAFALISLLAPLWMPRLPWKATALVAYVVAGIGVVMLAQVPGEQIPVAMFVMGLGSGVLFTISVGALSEAKDPDSAFGYMLSAQMIVGAILVYAIANLIAAQFGYQGFVFGLLALYLLTGIGVLWLPTNFMSAAATDSGTDTTAGGINVSAILAAAAMFLYFGAYTGVWSFVVNVGIDHGIAEDSINAVITGALISGIAGAFLCAWMGQRFGQTLPLAGGMLLMMIAILLLIYGRGLPTYVVAVCAINALLQFVVAYQMGLITEVDNNGRYTVLMPFFLAISAAICGDLMGGFIEGYGLATAMLGSVVAIAIALLLSLVVLSKNRVRIAAHTP
jgi:predicted MFS family arabinose efflux permease